MLSGAETSLPASKPGSIARADCRLRTKSPAATRSSSDRATSATTSILLRLNRLSRPPPSPEAFLSASTRPGRDALSAGATPNTIPVTKDSTSEKSSTRASMANSIASGNAPCGGGAAWNARTTTHASAMPARPPIDDSSTLSVRSCRTRRARLAPTASRTASSRRRDAALESRRLAMFAHAISSTAPTTPPSSSATDRISSR